MMIFPPRYLVFFFFFFGCGKLKRDISKYLTINWNWFNYFYKKKCNLIVLCFGWFPAENYKRLILAPKLILCALYGASFRAPFFFFSFFGFAILTILFWWNLWRIRDGTRVNMGIVFVQDGFGYADFPEKIKTKNSRIDLLINMVCDICP